MSKLLEYEGFLDGKARSHEATGFDIPITHEWLFPFQRFVTEWALRKGRAAVFADTGLGKTRIQVAWADAVALHTGLPVLILCPLAVAGQTIEEAAECGIEVGRLNTGIRIEITNYDRLKDVDPTKYSGIVLDESSILKNFAGAMRNRLVDSFAHTAFRLCLTATPAPNDHTELGNHAEFLGVMGMSGMLSRWFVHDSMDTSEWRLKGHAETEFWRWCASWAIAFRKPSDIGFADDNFDLPPLEMVRHTVETDPSETGSLISDAKLSATTLHKEMRRTADERAAAIAAIVSAEPDEPWLIWCNTDYEADAVRKVLPHITEVAGSMKPETKEQRLLGFAHGNPKDLLTKPSVAGFGMNWQQCSHMAFVGLSYSYEAIYQAIRRCWRYGQTRPVIAHIVTADSEWSILESIDRKREDHERLVARMIDLMGQGELAAECGLASQDAQGVDWRLLAGDCVERMKDIETASVGYSIFSPPFASLYTYTDAPEDMGNCQSDAEFFAHLDFLVPEIRRVLKPGRLVSMHCMDLPSTKERDGVIALRDFPGDLIRLFEKHGFVFHSRVTIWKDPLVAMQRTKALGLIHKQLVKDSSMSRQGIADYLVTLRAPGINPDPITHGAGFDRYVGEDAPTAQATSDPKTNKYGHEVWQRYASPVWMDINPTDVLSYRGAREERDERHICPLQLQVIERGIELWSNPGDVILSPFAGIGSEGFRAIQCGRKFVGIELKASYFEQATRNLSKAGECVQPVLFDGLMEVAS